MSMSVIGLLVAGASTAAPQPKEVFPVSEVRRISAQYADCAVKRRPSIADRIVEERSADDKLFDKIMMSDCLPRGRGSYRALWDRPLLHYALANALLRADRSLSVGDPTRLPRLNHGTVEEEVKARSSVWHKLRKPEQVETRRQLSAATIAVSEFGECVVRAAPSGVGELIRSEVASQAERVALRNLIPVLGHCVDKGGQVSFSPEVIRGTVAMSFYRLAKLARAAGGASQPGGTG